MKLAALPLNVTAVAPMKFAPLIATLVPTEPHAGATLVMLGGAPFKNAFKTLAVARWIRGSTRLVPKGPGSESSAQLQDIVPAANTHARLGAW